MIATSPAITIMPPTTAKIWLRRNGSMRRETFTVALSPHTYQCPPCGSAGASHGAPHLPGARDSPMGPSRYLKNIGHGAALSDMGYEPRDGRHPAQRHPTRPVARRPFRARHLGAGWVPFTSKTRPSGRPSSPRPPLRPRSARHSLPSSRNSAKRKPGRPEASAVVHQHPPSS